ncbi:MAG: carboxypeptidase-like regulatory domain-containing protein [Candidatus Riflebacteria bacterium]|nr:carboxypeptidase-like regulatory domain-containing protein [Candidatus Riflebacteria bacterium]
MKNLFKVFILLTIAVALTATGCGGGGGGGSTYTAPIAETGSIAGTIVNNTIAIGSVRADGLAAGQVIVYVEQNPSLTTLAGASGTFLLENVPAGAVNLIAEHKGTDNKLYRMRSGEITVEAAKTTEIPAAIVVTAADKQITGRVVNANTSASIADVAITAWGKPYTSDTTGAFTLTELPDLAFQFKLEKAGYETKIVEVETGGDFAKTFMVELTPAAAALPGATTATIKGKVVASINQSQFPENGALVFCEQYLNLTTKTDADGNYTLSNVPAGKVNIVAVGIDETKRARTEELTITGGQILDLTGTPMNLTLVGGSVGGFVYVTGGVDGVDDVGVKITALEKSVETAADGSFRILNLPAQKILVRFEKLGLVTREMEVNLADGDFNNFVEMFPLKLEELEPVVEDEGLLRSLDKISKTIYKMPIDEDGNNMVITVEAIARLPEITGLRRSDLYMFSNDGNYDNFVTQVEKDGFITTRAVTASSSPALVMLGIKDKSYLYTYHPMLLKVWHPNDTQYNNYIDAKSTAEALVLFDNVLWGLEKEKFLIALNKVRNHSLLSGLTSAVELALRAPDSETLFSDTLMQQSQAIAKSVAQELDVITDASQSMRSSLRAATGDVDTDKVIYVEDDAERKTTNVLLTNRSYCHYTVTIQNGMTNLPVPSPIGNNYFILPRSTLAGYSWTWPPDRKNQVEASLGAGEFNISFSKQKNLSVFDGFMTFAGTVIGTGASTYDELSDGLKLLATTGGGLMEIINQATTANINSSADAIALVDQLLFSTGKVGFEVLMDFAPKYFGAKLKRELKQSWFKTAAKFMFKKALIWGVAVYNTTEVALIVYDVAKAPDGHSELGWQTQAGWYGDLFAEKIDNMKTMRIYLNLPVNGTAYYFDGASFDTTNGDLGYDGSPVSTGFTFTANPIDRLLTGVDYEQTTDRGNIKVAFSNLKFNGFHSHRSSVFDETMMSFVWGSPKADMVQISKINHKDITPIAPDFSNMEYWVYSSTEWESITPSSGHYAGVILSE